MSGRNCHAKKKRIGTKGSGSSDSRVLSIIKNGFGRERESGKKEYFHQKNDCRENDCREDDCRENDCRKNEEEYHKQRFEDCRQGRKAGYGPDLSGRAES